MKQLNLLPKKEQTKSITFYAELKLFTKFTELYKKRGITMRKALEYAMQLFIEECAIEEQKNKEL